MSWGGSSAGSSTGYMGQTGVAWANDPRYGGTAANLRQTSYTYPTTGTAGAPYNRTMYGAPAPGITYSGVRMPQSWGSPAHPYRKNRKVRNSRKNRKARKTRKNRK